MTPTVLGQAQFREWLKAGTEWVAVGIEAGGVIILTVGTIVATALFVAGLLRRGWSLDLYRSYRSGLGRSILLGLEFLVGADIINTVAIEPSLRSAGVLAIIVVIRSSLSFALEAEINGHWPWKETELKARAGEEIAKRA